MSDRRSRFNPSPCPFSPSSTHPYPRSATPPSSRNDPMPRPTPTHSTTNSTTTPPPPRPRYVSSRKLAAIHANVAHAFARQKRRRTLTWLSEAQMTRQLTSNVWKLQTREERLVLDLGIVRAVVAEMIREIDEMEEGEDDVDEDGGSDEGNEGEGNARRNALKGFARRHLRHPPKPECAPVPTNGQITAARSHLRAWQAFIDAHFHRACAAVVTNSRTPLPRSPDDLDDFDAGYDILARVLAIRPTRADKTWFADLPSLGETVAFSGLRGLPDGRVKAVVWHVAEVYAAFTTERWLRTDNQKIRGLEGKRWAETVVETVLETGEALRESVLFGEDVGGGEDAAAMGGEDVVDAEVVELCESFDGMRLIEVGSDGVVGSSRWSRKGSQESRGRSRRLREKIEKLWEKAMGWGMSRRGPVRILEWRQSQER